jgi:CRISPR-associated protein Cas1
MKRHQNTLFVTTPGCYLRARGDAVRVDLHGEMKLHVPLRTLCGIVCFGSIGASPRLLGLCAASGVPVTFLSAAGRLQATVHGASHGNVLLRREQFRWADSPERCLSVARVMIAAKLANCRTVLLRATRDDPALAQDESLHHAASVLARCGKQALEARTLDGLRGTEGEGAATYFGAIGRLVAPDSGFSFSGRSRRPPRDAVNAMLSFTYALLRGDALAACETVGLDSAVGFLHRDRSGRPGLALDLMEEFRPVLADRLVLTLVNRRQVRPGGFIVDEAGGVRMSEDTRRTLITAFQRRKQDVMRHPFLGEETSVGLLVHLQARLLARHVRGDLDAYPALIWR